MALKASIGSHAKVPYSGFYLRGPNICEFCEVLTSLQILFLKQLFSFHTVNVLIKYTVVKPHNTCTCPTTVTVVPLHVATAKGP